jgi:hypothetical protein
MCVKKPPKEKSHLLFEIFDSFWIHFGGNIRLFFFPVRQGIKSRFDID